jgi:GxxExxY protein
MPVLLPYPITVLSQGEFHLLDERVMGYAFEIQNRLGRLLPEEAYKKELAYVCRSSGIAAEREVMLRVQHGAFSQDYFIDLLLEGSTIIEAKTVSDMTSAHSGQGINYLLLAGTHHGSLINFRSAKVERRFLSSRLRLEDRRLFVSQSKDWPGDEPHRRVRETLDGFCKDVGLGLDLPLYREAVVCLAGLSKQMVGIKSEGRVLSQQEMTLVTEEVALAITGLSDTQDYRLHLRRMLATTSLKGISWINLTLGNIRYEQIKQMR